MTFTNWATNEPNNDFGEIYMVGVQPDMKFDDKNAYHKTQVICQDNFDNGELITIQVIIRNLFRSGCNQNWVLHYYGGAKFCWYHIGKYM